MDPIAAEWQLKCYLMHNRDLKQQPGGHGERSALFCSYIPSTTLRSLSIYVNLCVQHSRSRRQQHANFMQSQKSTDPFSSHHSTMQTLLL